MNLDKWTRTVGHNAYGMQCKLHTNHLYCSDGWEQHQTCALHIQSNIFPSRRFECFFIHPHMQAVEVTQSFPQTTTNKIRMTMPIHNETSTGSAGTATLTSQVHGGRGNGRPGRALRRVVYYTGANGGARGRGSGYRGRGGRSAVSQRIPGVGHVVTRR